jgi:cation transport ATPase
VLIGNSRLMAENRVEVTAQLEQQMTRFYDYGKSTMIVCVDSTIIGVIAIADTIRVSIRSNYHLVHLLD